MMRVLALSLLLAGCAHAPLDPAQAEAERQRQLHCAGIEIYPPGVRPSRDYRVLGPVQSTSETMQASRYASLQQSACQVGADAVIDPIEQTPFAATEGFANDAAALRTVLSGTAIRFTDRAVPVETVDNHAQ